MKAWRARGDALYAFVILGLFCLEAAVLGVLTWSALTGAARRVGVARAVILGSVVATGLALLLVTVFVLIYHIVTERRERATPMLAVWAERWTAVIFSGETAPPGPLPREAVDVLLSLREVLRGAESERVADLLRSYKIPDAALAGSRPSRYRLGRRWQRGTRGRRLASRLEALDVLAKARIPESFELLFSFVRDEHPVIRFSALRAAARTVAAMSPGPECDAATRRFTGVIEDLDLPDGVLEDALVLLGDAAPGAVREILSGPPARMRAALSVAGKLGLLSLVAEIGAQVAAPDPEVRAAAIRALAQLGYLPPDVEGPVMDALGDSVEFVRTQAVRAVSLLGQDLAVPLIAPLLEDSSWWVRRSAAQTLLRLGARGGAALQDVARVSTDRFAREMAAQILMDAGRMTPAEARRVREIA